MDEPRSVEEGREAFDQYYECSSLVRRQKRRLMYGCGLTIVGVVGLIAALIRFGHMAEVASVLMLLAGGAICLSISINLRSSKAALKIAQQRLHDSLGRQ